MSEPTPSPGIEIIPDGPYLVQGSVPLKRRRTVRSEHDEPVAWETTAVLETGERYALCRCGQSSNKPFCDGTHASVGFDGTETAASSTYDERVTVYPGEQLLVRDDRSVCEHAGFCSNRLTNVWELAGAPSDADDVLRAQLITMIELCPSGALSYRLTPEGDDLEPELDVEVGVSADGPLLLSGGIPVARADGRPFELRNRVTLCRCGASKNKPLCDGSHKVVGFTDA